MNCGQICIFVFYLMYGTWLVQCQSDDKTIVILQESKQADVNDKFTEIFDEIKSAEGVSFAVKFFQLDHDQLSDSITELCKVLSSGIVLVIDITWDPTWYDLIGSLRTNNVPYIHIDISIKPFARAFFKFIDYIGSYDVAMVLQNEKEEYEAIYEVLNQYSIRSITFEGLDEAVAQRILDMRPIPSNFIIFARPKEMTALLRNALKYKAIDQMNRWRLFFMDFVDPHAARQTIRQNPELTAFIPSRDMCCAYLKQPSNGDCQCGDKVVVMDIFLREILGKLTGLLKSASFQSHTVECPAIGDSSPAAPPDTAKPAAPNQFEGQLLEALASTTVVRQYQNISYRYEYYLNVDVYGRDGNNQRLEADESPVLMDLASIDNVEFIPTTNITLKAPRRFFRLGVTKAIPWSYPKLDKKSLKPLLDDAGNMIWEGYCVDFARRLSEKLDFDYVLVPAKTGGSGERILGLNNTWDGLVHDLMTADIDIALSAMKMTAEREEVIDFVAPYYETTGILIVIRKPLRQTSLFRFMTVLRVEVWLSIVGAILITSIMLWFLDKYSPYSAKNNKEEYDEGCRDFTFRESLWFSMTSFTPQGGGEAPKALSSRTLVAAYWLFVVLMLATFTANLAAFLTVERMQAPVASLDQLARQSRINYTVVASSDTHKYFINMKFAEDTLYRMWKELTLNSTSDQTQFRVWDYPIKEQYGHILLAINASEPVANASHGFQNVRDHVNADYAFIHDSAEIKYEISRSCELIEVGEVFAEQPYALAIQQGSQLQDELSKTILELQKERFFEGLTARYWNASVKADECPNNEESEGITLESLGGVFIATLFGLAFAMITLLIEVIYYRRRRAIESIIQVAPAIAKDGDQQQQTPPPSYDAEHMRKRPKVGDGENAITFGADRFIPASLSQRIPYIPVYQRRPIHSPQPHEYIE